MAVVRVTCCQPQNAKLNDFTLDNGLSHFFYLNALGFVYNIFNEHMYNFLLPFCSRMSPTGGSNRPSPPSSNNSCLSTSATAASAKKRRHDGSAVGDGVRDSTGPGGAASGGLEALSVRLAQDADAFQAAAALANGSRPVSRFSSVRPIISLQLIQSVRRYAPSLSEGYHAIRSLPYRRATSID